MSISLQLTTAAFSGGSRPSDKGRPGHPDPEIRGGQVSTNFFSALLASVWSKIKGGRAPGPLPWIRHWLSFDGHSIYWLLFEPLYKQRPPLSSVPKVAVEERFNCLKTTTKEALMIIIMIIKYQFRNRSLASVLLISLVTFLDPLTPHVWVRDTTTFLT